MDVIHRMTLNIENGRGQCYDRAATMAVTKHGVATQIKHFNQESFAVIIACH